MGKIFINYRRDDSRADAGRLYDRLQDLFPARVFRDVGSLEPGIEWRDAINKVLGDSEACIVIIGKNWLTIADAAGKRRLDDPRDTVRQELQTALKSGIRVFPVLVGGAQMPAEEDLPEDLKALARRNALEISEQDWNEDFEKLVAALEKSPGRSTSTLPRNSRIAMQAVVGATVVFVLAIGVALVSGVRGPKPVAPHANQAGLSPTISPAPIVSSAPIIEKTPPPPESVPAVKPVPVRSAANKAVKTHASRELPVPADIPQEEPPPTARLASHVEKARNVDATLKVRVTHRHGLNYRSFNYRTTRCEGWLTVARDGSVSYECDPRFAHDNRCDRVTFPPGSFTFNAADNDQLHLSASTGNYDFFADEKTIAAARRALVIAAPYDLRE
jgi:hypothetical protein